MKLGAYELLERVAVGGMAEVYRGRAVGEGGFEKLVAIKRILPHLARDSRFVSMLVQEARIHAGLSHRNIVQIHDLGQSEDGEYFIVLEYVDGHDLAALLHVMAKPESASQRVGDAVALHVVMELAQGVHSAHELMDGDGQMAGLVHRDISPSNVLVSYAGEVKLSDFGLAKRQTDHSVVGSLKGKLAYMSPEQARRWPLDRRSDIFSLGAVLFELLTGRRLREIEDEVEGWRLVASGVMSSPRTFRPDMPLGLERLLKRALAPDPKDRYADAAAFVAAAKQAMELVARPQRGEAAELQLVLRKFLPPGAPRPESPPSRVIRLQSQFLAGPQAPDDMGTTRPARGLPRPAAFSPQPHAQPAAPARPASPAAPSSQPVEAPLSAFPRPEGGRVRERQPSPARRVPADDLVPVAGELALPQPHRVTMEAQPLSAGFAQAAAAAHNSARAPGYTPPLSEAAAYAAAPATPLQLKGLGRTGGRAAGSRPTPARPRPPVGMASRTMPATTSHGTRPLVQSTLEGQAQRPSARAAYLALGTPGLDPAAPTPRLDVLPGQALTPAVERTGRLWGVAAALIVLAMLVFHFYVVPLPVVLRWGQPVKVVLHSEPEGAQVSLDGQPLAAATPTFANFRRDRKPHVVVFAKAGHESIAHTIRLDRHLRLTVRATLPRAKQPYEAPPPATLPPAALPPATLPPADLPPGDLPPAVPAPLAVPTALPELAQEPAETGEAAAAPAGDVGLTSDPLAPSAAAAALGKPDRPRAPRVNKKNRRAMRARRNR